MLIMLIPPIPHLGWCHKTGAVMVLSHLLKDKKYRDFYKSFDGFKLLDNSEAEGAQVSFDELIKAINLIKPDEVCAPDTLYSGYQTVTKTEQFIKKALGNIPKDTRIMGIPQGNSFLEYRDCFKYFTIHKSINTLGISKFSVVSSMKEKTGSDSIMVNRLYLLEWMKKNGYTKKPVHLLGLGNVNEIKHVKKFSFVRSIDSCFPFLSAINNVDFASERKIETPHNYFYHKTTKKQLNQALKNVDLLLKLSK